jgi:hypothetical protein
MNKLFFLSCLLILISIMSVGQQRDEIKSEEPPRKASKIIVMVRDSGSIILNRIAKMLFDNGFTIDTKDESTQTLSTKEFAPNHPSIFIKIRASVNDTSVIFTGTFAWTLTAGLRPQEFDPILYQGMKNSASRQAWNSLDLIAHKFGDKIVYAK